MGTGLGVLLLVVGLILVVGVIDLPAGVEDVVATNILGWILIIAGTLAIVLGLVMNRQRSRTTHVEERNTEI